MCGLFGVAPFDLKDIDSARSSLDELSHRGPDSRGEWYEGDCYIGHRRLSILDLSSSGHQPMQSANKNVVIACNGEVYNYRELKKQLEAEFNFTGNSDSEVILHGYQKWGIDGLLSRLEGMYAFVIFDKAERVIYLVRDRVGIKPLYWAVSDNQLIWASELKSIVKWKGENNLRLDNSAVYDYLNHLYIPPPKTIYESVYKLEAASVLRFNISNSKVTVARYWSIDSLISLDKRQPGSAKELQEILSSSVRSHLQSDVPVGVYLSGGLDSSIISFLANKISHTDLNAFSIDVPDATEDQVGHRVMAKFLGLLHYVEKFDEKEFASLSGILTKLYDEPFADTSAFPTYALAKLTKKHNVKVVLTGDGGDELFFGYRWYQSAQNGCFQAGWVKRYAKDFLKSRKLWNNLAISNDLIRYQESLGGMRADCRFKQLKKLGLPSDYDPTWYLKKYYRSELPHYLRWRYLDFHTYLPEDILTKVDRATMANSIEARVPFLALDVIKYAFSVDAETINSKQGLKVHLKDAFRSSLPSEVVDREKRGFSIPVNKWGTYGHSHQKQFGILAQEFNAISNRVFALSR